MRTTISSHSLYVETSCTRSGRYDTSSFLARRSYRIIFLLLYFSLSTMLPLATVSFANTRGAQINPPCIHFLYFLFIKFIIFPSQPTWLRVKHTSACAISDTNKTIAVGYLHEWWNECRILPTPAEIFIPDNFPFGHILSFQNVLRVHFLPSLISFFTNVLIHAHFSSLW